MIERPTLDRIARTVRADRGGTEATIFVASTVLLEGAWLDDICGALSEGAGQVVVHGVPREFLVARPGPADAPLVSQAETTVRSGGVRVRAGAARIPHIGARRPLLGAVLIVKDEEETLAGCLESLHGFVEEVVVYDTGSADRTMEIARSAGAIVIAGYWDDHFGNARNRALDHSTAEWVLSIDADEVVAGDPVALRRTLRATALDYFGIVVSSTIGQAGGATFDGLVGRLFRRARCRWTDALHEQLASRDPARPKLSGAANDDIKLLHSGYTTVRLRERDKGARNLAIAEAAAAGTITAGSDPNRVWANLGRSRALTGEHAKALEAFDRFDPEDDRREMVLETANSAFQAAVIVGDRQRAEHWLNVLERRGEPGERLKRHAALLLHSQGRFEEALALLNTIVDAVDRMGRQHRRVDNLQLELACLVALGRTEEAADALVAALRQDAVGLTLHQCIAHFTAADRPVRSLVQELPLSMHVNYLGQSLNLPPTVADDFLEAMWEAGHDHPRTLVAAAARATDFPVERAAAWSRRLRAAGLAEECPLREVARDQALPLRRRIVAAAVAVEEFEDVTVLPLLEQLLSEVTDDCAAAVIDDLRRQAPNVGAAVELATF
ncbi:tetratricopeptide repeat-containing glycosyltransferase family 2 protein [Kineococcus sp. NUM-3379]